MIAAGPRRPAPDARPPMESYQREFIDFALKPGSRGEVQVLLEPEEGGGMSRQLHETQEGRRHDAQQQEAEEYIHRPARSVDGR